MSKSVSCVGLNPSEDSFHVSALGAQADSTKRNGPAHSFGTAKPGAREPRAPGGTVMSMNFSCFLCVLHVYWCRPR